MLVGSGRLLPGPLAVGSRALSRGTSVIPATSGIILEVQGLWNVEMCGVLLVLYYYLISNRSQSAKAYCVYLICIIIIPYPRPTYRPTDLPTWYYTHSTTLPTTIPSIPTDY